MEPTPIRLLIADDSLETCDILENYFGLIQEITVCGIAHDGEEALFCIGQSQPDVLLLDLIMPKLDGLAVLDRLSQIPLTKRPRIIVTSAVGQESFTSTAISMGADYYMIKPCDLEDLHARIRTAAALNRTRTTPEKSAFSTALNRLKAAPAQSTSSVIPERLRSMTEQRAPLTASKEETDPTAWISQQLLELGAPSQLLGFRYCVEGVCILFQSEGPHSIVKDVYAQIATKYGTTIQCVEGAIRKVVRRAWESEAAAVSALTGSAGTTQPTNGRFLTSLAQRLRLRQKHI